MWRILLSCFLMNYLYVGFSTTSNNNQDFGTDVDALVSMVIKEAKQKVSRAVRRTSRKWKKDDVWEDPMTLFQFFKQPPSEESARMAMAGDVFECALDMMKDKVRKHHPGRYKRRVNATDMLTEKTLQDLITFSGCKANIREPKCLDTCYSSLYRTIDGTCNNLKHPWWGAANIPLARWRPSIYENGFSTPVGWNPDKLYNSFKLPLVRQVSNDIIGTTNARVTGDPNYSHMLVVWGQYIDHDIDFTPQSLSTSTFQGLTNCKTTCKNEPPCYPIKVPANDPRIKRECLPFFRSASVCGTGDTSSLFFNLLPREQINTITSFVDASLVYGSSKSVAMMLRNSSSNEGLLRVNTYYFDVNGREYLPFNPNNPCVQSRDQTDGQKIPCFLAGDGRVSEHLTLSSIHTLWVREHNRIARKLKMMNPHWHSEIIYQEARKIVGAYHQVINWKEYLPKILGQKGVKMMGNYTGYKPDENPSIANVFSTAAFRFGHVTISPEFRRLDENYKNHPQFPSILLHQAFFSPWRMVKEGGIDPILRGLIGRAAKLANTNEIMHDELREKLFALENQVALDLASLNLQRGRDHALPFYNDWREECGLRRAQNFSDLAEEIKNSIIREKLKDLYGHPSNIDLWMGGLAEDIESDSRLGPVFNCLISRQFKLLRNGDRYYYENYGVFTKPQVEALNKLSMARLICDNSDLDYVQRDAFLLAEYPRDFVACSDIPKLDLSLWREVPMVASCGKPPDVDYGFWRICGNVISYQCVFGYELVGEEEIECMGGAYTPLPPTCRKMMSCSMNNGDCQEVCSDDAGALSCSCAEGRTLDTDGRSCVSDDLSIPPTAASSSTHLFGAFITVGSILAVVIVVILLVLLLLSIKYTKLRKTDKRKRKHLNGATNKGMSEEPDDRI